MDHGTALVHQDPSLGTVPFWSHWVWAVPSTSWRGHTSPMASTGFWVQAGPGMVFWWNSCPHRVV